MKKRLVSVSGLTIGFSQPGEEIKDVVHGIDFSIAPGESLALVGESGCGKSVAAKSLLGLLPGNSRVTGELLFDGEPVQAMNPSGLQELRGGRVGMIFQEPLSALNPLHRVGKQIAESLFLHGGPKRRDAEVLNLLDRVGLPDPAHYARCYPHELSGGQRQRVMIAMAIANRPDLLIADEPTTALDVTVQDRILSLLEELRSEIGMAMLFITHDLSVVRRMADRIAVMKDGKILETADRETLFSSPVHPWSRKLIEGDIGGFGIPESQVGELLLKVEGLSVKYPVKKGVFQRVAGHVDAVSSASLTLSRGETLAIVGESGSGKSSLAQGLLRLIPCEGAMWLGDTRLDTLDTESFRKMRPRMQMVFQDPFDSLSPRMTMGEIVEEGLEEHTDLTREERQERIHAVLAEVGLDPEQAHRYPHEFSGGQRQRIAIARALILNPWLMILDEATSSLDRSVQFQIVGLLKKLQKDRGLSYLFISHDLSVVRSISHRVVVMKEGKIVEAGITSEVSRSPRHPYTQELLGAMP